MKYTGLSVYIRLFSAILIIIFSPGCSLNNSPDTATVTVNLGLNEKGEVRSITGKDAAPAGITGISLTVSAPDMRTRTEVIPLATGKITLNVPAGKARLFRVTAYDPTGNLGGSATKDLEAGTPADLTIAMAYQYTGVTINVNYPDGTPGSSSLTYGLNVSNSGVTSNYTFPSSGSTVQVGSGDARDLEVLVNTPSVTFRGTVTGQSLTAGGSAAYTVDVTLYEAKLVIPDNVSARVVQIDNMADLTEDILNASSISYLQTFGPADVDFDIIGRIYIANSSTGSTGFTGIFRVDDITSNTFTSIIQDTTVQGIAIDRVNNVLYYVTTASTIGKIDMGTQCATYPCTSTPLSNANLSAIQGLDVDDTGMLYLACNLLGAGNTVVKYDPSGGGSIVTNSALLSGTPWDVLFMSPYIYVANLNGATNEQIIRFNTDFTNQAGYGVPVFVSSVAKGDFYGPRRFLAIRPNDIVIIDDRSGVNNLDKLISMEDMTGLNWQTYGNSTTYTMTEFNFYDFC